MQMHFGSSDRMLYGVYHAAASPRLRRGVVLLNPYGWEALRAHRTLRALALRLAGAGIDVLRFDYSCTGDSLGDTADASWEDWLEDAEYAVDELQAIAGVPRVSLVGLRMGALIASELSRRSQESVDRLVLWAPPSDGRRVVEWARSGPAAEVAAFPLGERLATELDSARPLREAPSHVSTLVLQADPDQTADRAGPETDVIRVADDERRCWIEDRDLGAGAVPASLLVHITEWLAE